MRYAAFLLLLLSGCTLVPIADAGPCAAITNARGCQTDPYFIKRDAETASASQGDSSQKAGTAR
jgi:hypothetical protein